MLQRTAWHDALSHLDSKSFDAHWKAFQAAFEAQDVPMVWLPNQETIDRSNIQALVREIGLRNYAELHRWSVTQRGAFWDRIARDMGLPVTGAALQGGPEDPVWFGDSEWNITQSCFRHPADAPAVIDGGEGRASRTWTFGELRALTDRVSHALLQRGFATGDAVALYMPMTVECVALYLGIVQAGLAVVSIPDSFAPAEVQTRLRLGGAKMLCTVDSFTRGGKSVPMYAKAHEAAAAMDLPCLVIGADPESVRGDDVLWDAFVGAAPEARFEPVLVAPDHVSNVLFSSGTTGEPKAIPWTHLTPLKAAMDGKYHQDVHPEDVVAWPTNIGWMMGPWLIYASLMNGAPMALFEGAPTGPAFLNFLRESNVTVLGVVPAIVKAWRAEGVQPGALPNIRVFSSTGEASNREDYLFLMSLANYHAPIIEYCGGTEIGGGHMTGSIVQPCSPATFTTPALGIDFVVLDDDGKPAKPGGMGEIFLIPPSVGLSQRLLNRDHHEAYYAGCPNGPRGEVLRRHGDEVQVLPGGFWAAQGRADDTMNLGGIKVASVELERVMNAEPGVVETAAVAVRPPGGGADQLVVFAVLDGAPDEALQARLQGRIKKGLNPLFRIHDVVPVEALPRTASNKIMRRTLRDEYTA